ncbi:MAG: transglycosylase SLT domain-containing protein, partial [Deltaproteobacteria bacterium]|nr:transglycosylase SLT domain-containing protein [Deltaproteobacteria bacterium]
MRTRVLVGSALGLLLLGCGDDDGSAPGTDAATGRDTSLPDVASPSHDGGREADATAGDCATNPLRTGLVAEQTGVSVDAFDCDILRRAAEAGEPDPMIVKAMIYVESRFDHTAAGCTNLPCGMPTGWTAEESGCFGLMQVVPACGGEVVAPCLLPDGHPNMTTDESSSAWATSVFNPSINIRIGIAGLAGNRAEVESL